MRPVPVFEFHDHAQSHEYAEGDDQEVDYVLDEHAVVHGHFLDLGEVSVGRTSGGDHVFEVGETVSAGDYGDHGHDDIIDKRADDFAECAAHDHTDCHVNDVAFHGKLLEVGNE